MSVASPVANFLPLCALLEEKELKIADPVQISINYNEVSYTEEHFVIRKPLNKTFLVINMSNNSVYFWLAQNNNPNSSVNRLQTAICIGYRETSQGNYSGSNRKEV